MKTLQIPIKELNLQPGIHKIRVKADSSTHIESDFSNYVENIKITAQLKAPTIYLYDAIIYFLLVPYATTDKFTYTVSGVWHNPETEEPPITIDIIKLKPKIDPETLKPRSYLLAANLKSIKDAEEKLKIKPGIWFISVKVSSDDQPDIYLDSEASNYVFYLAKTPLDPPTDLSIQQGATYLYFTPSTLEGEINYKYAVYLDGRLKKNLFAKYDEKNKKYYLDLSELNVVSKTYEVQLSATPTTEQEDKYTSSLLTDKVIWAKGAYKVILVKETEEQTQKEASIFLKDSTGNFMCALPNEVLYYLNQKQATAFKKELQTILDYCRYQRY